MKKIIVFTGYWAISLIMVACGNSNVEGGQSFSSTTDSSDVRLPIQERYSEYTDKVIQLFSEMGLSPEDYIPEDTSTSRIDFRANSVNLTNNYQNMISDNLNSVFSDVSVSAKSIFEKLGRPDVICIDRDSGVEDTYNIDVYWYKSNEVNSDYVRVEWPLEGSSYTKSVSGIPSDMSDNGFQIIVEQNTFKGTSK
ncbi:hypothetical protein AB1I63_08525 [Streptococcus pneumoniae]